MQSTTSPDTMRAVTEQDVLGALVALGSLPKRQSDDAELDLAAYRVALDGTQASDLASAVVAILRGSLAHAFFPSPPEFRMQCDKEANVRWAIAARHQRRQAELEERTALRQIEHSDEAKERVAAIHRRFHESLQTVTAENGLTSIRAKYDKAILDQIPDRESDGTWQLPKGALSVKMMTA